MAPLGKSMIQIKFRKTMFWAWQVTLEANLVGHSSPNGSSGEVSKDTSGLTTALHIVKRITVIIQ